MIAIGVVMPDLLTVPPPPEAISAMVEIPRLQITPGVLATQQGPDGDLGPESAGAILMLQATFADVEGAQRFWAAAVPLMELLASAPGFIRRYSFLDGPTNTLLAWWRTADHARAFAASPQHRAAVRDLYQERWQYSHFSAIWEMTSNHGRMIFCDRCDGITHASERVCSVCGTPFTDVYRQPEAAASGDEHP
jgi:heme-degrading monooxygenase HmoA